MVARVSRHGRLAVVALILALVLSVGTLSSVSRLHTAHAYVDLCCHWPGNVPNSCCYDFNVYYEFLISTDITAFNNGNTAWNFSAAYVNFSQDSSGQDYQEASDYYDSGDQQDGKAPFTNGGNLFTSMDMELNSYWTLQYSTGKNQSVAAHEEGHMASLDDVKSWDGHCADIQLMYIGTHQRYDTCGVKTPQHDDIVGVNAQY